jgi:hypothetical protein
MKQKPNICLIDEDENVRIGWAKALEGDANLIYFQDHLELFNRSAHDKHLMGSLACIIVGRYFRHLNLDLVTSGVPETIKSGFRGPLFLNWQGYITKDEVHSKFDGKLFHRYGVKWQTLRLRIQKFEKTKKLVKKEPYERPLRLTQGTFKTKGHTRPERCSELLRAMAKRAIGEHRARIEYYAMYDQKTGMMLLEAIYNKLLTDKDRPQSCPSRYINSSPVIAQRILHEALYN